ncbi:hypothetical protein PsorP6_005899 [Peronosclerospora sorghi]|uniref:Uncharacterized protein n=1 Tax=Peronosclerospora sorghi TaxID=230839 RepID=A0ACC0W335_9STRA|nr:hypothetical protein PsorP6_005899 [Peronosclerospora sorghi]
MTSRLDVQSAKMAEGSEAVCIFVNNVADEATLRVLHAGGTKVLLLRCAGYDIVNLQVAKELEMHVLRVPAYPTLLRTIRQVLAYDIKESPDALRFGAEYFSQGEIWARSDIISLHCPLLPSTKHVINAESIAKKHGVILINTSRGGLIDTKGLVSGLKRGKIGSVGLDVFEGEGRPVLLLGSVGGDHCG